jgi:uncharacterized DUF497 family protein
MTNKTTITQRNYQFEQELCNAISKRVLVKLKYDTDTAERTFACHGVYYSTNAKVLVVGTQIDNPAEPSENNQPRNFEIGKLTSISLTEIAFIPDERFNPSDKRYSSGFIAKVY